VLPFFSCSYSIITGGTSLVPSEIRPVSLRILFDGFVTSTLSSILNFIETCLIGFYLVFLKVAEAIFFEFRVNGFEI
jgi:hypothetical protein